MLWTWVLPFESLKTKKRQTSRGWHQKGFYCQGGRKESLQAQPLKIASAWNKRTKGLLTVES